MRILWIASRPSPVIAALSRLGHQVIATEPSARRVAWQCARHRIERAYVELCERTSHAAVPLIAFRIPYFVALERPHALQLGLQLAARASRGAIVCDEAVGRWAVDVLGAPEASIIPRGIDLDVFAPGDPAEAKRALELQPNLRTIALIDDLTRELRLEVLAEAHRKLSGTGLLIASDGPRADYVQAMRAATRPSSPVIFLGSQSPTERALAIRASEIGVSLNGGRAEFAACGRRQVALRTQDVGQGEEAERIASICSGAVRIVDHDSASLRTALEETLDAPALPDLETIRSVLGWDHVATQLDELLVD